MSVQLTVEVRDVRGHTIRVPFSLTATMGDIRNVVNCEVPSSYKVSEFQLIPVPYWHYTADHPETFLGPGDDWRLIDVCFEEICRDLDNDQDVTVTMGSVAPLGPQRAIGLLFPDSRDVEEKDLPPAGAAIFRAAQEFGTTSRRLLSLCLSLGTLEEDLRNDRLRPEDITAVAGFGFDGEVAALVFCGCLCLEDAVRCLEATSGDEKRFNAYSIVGQDSPTGVVSHRIIPERHSGGAVVVVSRASSEEEPPKGGKPMAHDLIEHLGAHTPFFDDDDTRVDLMGIEEDDDDDDDTPRYAFVSNGRDRQRPSLMDTLRDPVDWAATIRAMHDLGVTHFLEVGLSSRLTSFLPLILDDVTDPVPLPEPPTTN